MVDWVVVVPVTPRVVLQVLEVTVLQDQVAVVQVAVPQLLVPTPWPDLVMAVMVL